MNSPRIISYLGSDITLAKEMKTFCDAYLSDSVFHSHPSQDGYLIDYVEDNKPAILILEDLSELPSLELELPLFSALKFILPLNFNAFVVPQLYEIKKVGGKFHYMELIYGIHEDNLKKIRKSVDRREESPLEETAVGAAAAAELSSAQLVRKKTQQDLSPSFKGYV